VADNAYIIVVVVNSIHTPPLGRGGKLKIITID